MQSYDKIPITFDGYSSAFGWTISINSAGQLRPPIDHTGERGTGDTA
jgi:hypothetical protein